MELHNTVFMCPQATGSFRKAVDGGGSRNLHEKFIGYRWGQCSRSPAALWLGWNWSWKMGRALGCHKAGLVTPTAMILDPISQNLLVKPSCSLSTSFLNLLESHPCKITSRLGRGNENICDLETSSDLCSYVSLMCTGMNLKWRARICSKMISGHY